MLPGVLFGLFFASSTSEVSTALDRLKVILERKDAVPGETPPVVSDAVIPLGFSRDGKFAYVDRYGPECVRSRVTGKYIVRDPRHPLSDEDSPRCRPRGIHTFVILDTRTNARVSLHSRPRGEPPVFDVDDIAQELPAHGIEPDPELAVHDFPVGGVRGRLRPTAACACVASRSSTVAARGVPDTRGEASRPQVALHTSSTDADREHFDCGEPPARIQHAPCDARATVSLVRSDGKQRLVGVIDWLHSYPVGTMVSLGTAHYYETPEPERIVVAIPVAERADGWTIRWHFFGVRVDDGLAFTAPPDSSPWRSTAGPENLWITPEGSFVGKGGVCFVFDRYVARIDEARRGRPVIQVFRRLSPPNSLARSCDLLHGSGDQNRAAPPVSRSEADRWGPTQPVYTGGGDSNAVFFKGIWKDFLLLDHGTSAIRHLIVWDLARRAEVLRVAYKEPVTFSRGRLQVGTEISRARAAQMAPRTKCPRMTAEEQAERSRVEREDDGSFSRTPGPYLAFMARRTIELASLRSTIGPPVKCVVSFVE